MTHNLLLMSDAYKYSHHKQYPKGSEFVEIYIESRLNFEVSTFAGLQAFCLDYLVGKAFTRSDIYEADQVCRNMGIPFNHIGWDLMYERYGGRLPISIKAVPEGTRMETSNVQMVISNTDADFPWLPGFLETVLLRAVWYPSTVATTSREIKDIIKYGLDKSSDDPEGEIMFKLHDFGARGITSHESAEIGGMAHLLNFYGTDTVEAVRKAIEVFQDEENYLVGASIPAMEHSTITSWGKPNEANAYRNMLESYPTGLVSIVSDSYDIWNALSNIFGEELRGLVINRDGTLVIRPDSGHPVETPIRVIKELMNEFGYTWNKKGFKVLPDYLRVLQGDGIGIDEVDQICTKLLNSDISISNIAFGMGGGLLQKTDRDVLDYACKCSAIKIDGVWRSVQKDPITDSSKKSKKGLLRLIHVNGEYKTIDTLGNGAAYWGNLPDELHLIFSNGALIERSTLKEARERANK